MLMKASIIDLRYKMSEVLAALDRNEVVNVMYHGKLKAIISPIKTKSSTKIEDHPAFGMYKNTKSHSVATIIKKLRKERYHDF